MNTRAGYNPGWREKVILGGGGVVIKDTRSEAAERVSLVVTEIPQKGDRSSDAERHRELEAQSSRTEEERARRRWAVPTWRDHERFSLTA